MIAVLTCCRSLLAERKAIGELALVEESIYVPHDAILLAEYHSSRADHYAYASAYAAWFYMAPRSCEKIVAEYQEAMTDSGWTVGSVGNCDKDTWLTMVTSGAVFHMYGEPLESQLEQEWQHLREQYDDKGMLYNVIVNVAVPYD